MYCRILQSVCIILLTAQLCNTQILVATAPNTEFYIYAESIFRYDESVLFTARVTTSKYTRHDVILASCKKHTYVIPTSRIITSRNTDWYTPRNLKSYIAYKKSAMYIALDILCRIQPTPFHEY